MDIIYLFIYFLPEMGLSRLIPHHYYYFFIGKVTIGLFIVTFEASIFCKAALK